MVIVVAITMRARLVVSGVVAGQLRLRPQACAVGWPAATNWFQRFLVTFLR